MPSKPIKRRRRQVALPSGEVALGMPLQTLSVFYFLGASVWCLTIGTSFAGWLVGMVGMMLWGFELKRYRERIARYVGIGLYHGQWYVRTHGKAPEDTAFVRLRYDSVVIPGLLVLSFQEVDGTRHSFSVVPSMVGGREPFSWLARYALLSPVFQSSGQ